MAKTEKEGVVEKNENKLTSYIKEFQTRNDFKKYILLSLFMLFLFETIIGLSFNIFFSEILEEKRKQNYTKAWENYLNQKWKSDFNLITGYVWWGDVWKKVYAGNIEQLHLSFNADSAIRENYDLFSVYLKSDSDPIYSIQGKNVKNFVNLEKELIAKLFLKQSNKTGIFHSIVKIQNKYYMLSVSSLCNDIGKPIYPGITIFAQELDKFLKLAEEVIPVTMEIKPGLPQNTPYHYLTIPNQFVEKDIFFIEIKPEYEIQSLILKTLFFFISIQIVLSLSLLILIIPRYTQQKTQKLEEMIKAAEELNLELINKVNELKKAKEETEKSEAKYKHLVESSKDIIFSFDNNGFILTANKALVEYLGLKQEDLIGKYFLDLAYNSDNKIDSLEKQLLMEKLEELKVNQDNVSFDMTFRTKNNEPLQLGVKWEYVKIRDSFVVFGKAFTVSEDSMLKYFESENRKYVFNNYITLAEQVSQRITSNLVKYIDPEQTFNVRICVREIIINSIEHGNLNIDYETKTELRKTKGGYFRFLQERQKDPLYKNRKVTVWYSLKSDRVSFLVKDEGKGFDHKKLLADNANTANTNFLDHGRGIFMTKNTFDKIKYNQSGNKVLLVKYFRK